MKGKQMSNKSPLSAPDREAAFRKDLAELLRKHRAELSAKQGIYPHTVIPRLVVAVTLHTTTDDLLVSHYVDFLL